MVYMREIASELVGAKVPLAVKAGLVARAAHEGLTVSALSARVLAQAVTRWNNAKAAPAREAEAAHQGGYNSNGTVSIQPRRRAGKSD